MARARTPPLPLSPLQALAPSILSHPPLLPSFLPTRTPRPWSWTWSRYSRPLCSTERSSSPRTPSTSSLLEPRMGNRGGSRYISPTRDDRSFLGRASTSVPKSAPSPRNSLAIETSSRKHPCSRRTRRRLSSETRARNSLTAVHRPRSNCHRPRTRSDRPGTTSRGKEDHAALFSLAPSSELPRSPLPIARRTRNGEATTARSRSPDSSRI